MKKLRISILLIAFVFSLSHTQSYYPLELNNRWDYYRSWWEPGGYSSSDSFSVRVIGDTVLSGNSHYYILNRSDLTMRDGFYLVRADSSYVYYYFDSQEVPYYKLDATIGEQWNAGIEVITLEAIDSTYLFNTFSRNLVYRIDGLILRWVTLSDKFGPLSYWSTGEPPGTCYESIDLMGCVLSNVQYGTLLEISGSGESKIYFELFQNYPNPFNHTTLIQYELEKEMNVELVLYNIIGERVKCLYKGNQSRGRYKISLNSNNLVSGLYIYSLKSDEGILYKKCLFIK